MLITVVEDNQALAAGIANRLRDCGHGVDLLFDGFEAAQYLETTRSDLVILDIELPGYSGLELLRALRRRNDSTLVLMLTARTEVLDRVRGLDAGADDYLCKPFALEELEARVRALLRRKQEERVATETIGELSFDKATRTLFVDDKPLDLPRRELAVFDCLLARRGRVVPKEVIVDSIYGTGADVSESVVEVYVSRLRKRLEPLGVEIKTARGLGYRLDQKT